MPAVHRRRAGRQRSGDRPDRRPGRPACAASRLTPGRRRPSSAKRGSLCLDVSLASNGTKNAMRSPGNSKSAGMTPTMGTIRARPSRSRKSAGLPMTSGSDWNSRRQLSKDSTTTCGSGSSASTSGRPSSAREPRSGKVLPDTMPPQRRAVPWGVRTKPIEVVVAATVESVLVLVRHCSNCSRVKPRDRRWPPARWGGTCWTMATSRSACWNGRGRRRIVSTTLKMAVAAPMPRPSVRMTTSAKRGAPQRPGRSRGVPDTPTGDPAIKARDASASAP